MRGVSFILFVLLVLNFSTPSPITSLDESNRIVNGFQINISEIPYQAAIHRSTNSGWSFACGASIITTKALITAAHCIVTSVSEPSSLRVAVGTSNRLTGGDTYKVSKVYAHETYSSVTLEHDIGMLVTSQKMSFGEQVDAVFIAEPTISIPVGITALVSGFGLTSYEGPISSTLLGANVQVVSQSACTRAYRRIAAISSGMICASATNPPRDACQGDSGGPLVLDKTLIGIVSWGEGCANVTYPGVYTRVSEYYLWIMNKLILI